MRSRGLVTVGVPAMRQDTAGLKAKRVRHLVALILIAGTAAVAAMGAVVGGPWSRLAVAVLVLSLATLCVLALRLFIARAAGWLVASQQRRTSSAERWGRGERGEPRFKRSSPSDHGRAPPQPGERDPPPPDSVGRTPGE